MRRLDETTWVAPRQIVPADLLDFVARGVRLIVNNRPAGEEPGQPSSAETGRAGGFPAERVAAMAEALERGPVLAFCRSGTRSTYLWALARASRGADTATLLRQAAEAGYDLRPIASYLTR